MTDPASRSVSSLTNSGFSFDFAQGGEPVEPRVKPGMTKTDYAEFYDCDTVGLVGMTIKTAVKA